jgi:hypothetical protein
MCCHDLFSLDVDDIPYRKFILKLVQNDPFKPLCMCTWVDVARIKERGLRHSIYEKFVSQLIFCEVVMKVVKTNTFPKQVSVAVTLDLYSRGS